MVQNVQTLVHVAMIVIVIELEMVNVETVVETDVLTVVDLKRVEIIFSKKL